MNSNTSVEVKQQNLNKISRFSKSDSQNNTLGLIESLSIKSKRPQNKKMYEDALKLVARGEITCRKIRKNMRSVESKEDFLAKVHCLRQGFKVMFRDLQAFNWIALTFQSIVAEILLLNELEPDHYDTFVPTYVEVLHFFLNELNKNDIKKDLQIIGIFHPTFYDVVLCYFMLDIFCDVEHLRNMLTQFEKHPQCHEQSQKFRRQQHPVLKFRKISQKRLIIYRDGILTLMNRLYFSVVPGIETGICGPSSLLKKAWTTFKKEAMDYIECLFSFDYVRYTIPAQMADDLLSLTKERLTRLERFVKMLGEAKNLIDAKKAKHENELTEYERTFWQHE